jgi:uncharacterized protein (UPF0248 family)
VIPIHQLLNRIRWDKEYSQAEFTIGYYDRVDDEIILVPLNRVLFESDDHFAVKIVDEDGALHSVPMHRIKIVYRNGEIIWQRTH